MEDLNKFQIDNDGNFSESFVDNSVSTISGIEVYFRDLERHLLSHIEGADAVFGAVAWLTSYPILDALAKKDNVSIIVQKEDFLRPDVGSRTSFKSNLRKKYDQLTCKVTRYSFGNILSSVSVACDPSLDPVRCVGNHNLDKAPAFPRMHNKFLVFAKVEPNPMQNGFELIVPYGVWTGSFNLTKNATLSLENALYITDPLVVNAYFKEFGQIAAMSEELDWRSDWAAPEWRIGT
ncbi:phospholipase D-like domain-containing protein [Vibrio plantisponsor]|uniref:Phospholipase D-like domain-containing protein n=1 Tax=Vibrio plantisponsor TaxID=664643 RepID=A0ABU4IE90_9VIBR|nr:phospholipase D-like domain-containing protein [Vibrio plantisponsor]MDW6016791.1 phospholipase D-like domain-containing protein [Vibrio plantisponsor]NNM39838.1 hypothetical protein [Vibrio plantisponsor]